MMKRRRKATSGQSCPFLGQLLLASCQLLRLFGYLAVCCQVLHTSAVGDLLLVHELTRLLVKAGELAVGFRCISRPAIPSLPLVFCHCSGSVAPVFGFWDRGTWLCF